MLAAVALILSCAGVLVAEEAVSHKAAFGKDGARIFSKRKMVEMDKLPLSGNVSSKSMAGVNPLAVSADVAMYGYLVYDEILWESGFCSINPQTLSIGMVDGMGSVGDMESPGYVAGTYANGLYYYYGCDWYGAPYYFASASFDSGEHTLINDPGYAAEYVISDITYDYSTQAMYGVGADDAYADVSFLFKADLATGEVERVADLDDFMYSVAATLQGELYAISVDGMLYKVDKSTGDCVEILDTQLYAGAANTMEFDHASDDKTLYWLYADDGYCSHLVEIDIESLSVTDHGTLAGSAQVCGLCIPYESGSMAVPAAPGHFSAVADENGELAAHLSWENPTTTVVGDPLSGTLSVEVYRNDESVYSIAVAKPGEALSYDDELTESGMVEYRVVATNAEGEGMAATASVYVGRDVPAAVDAVEVTVNDATSATVSWNAPVAGKHGGWFDASTLAYNIYRNPGNVAVAEGITDTRYSETGIEALGNYHYEVVAYTADGSGDAGTSDVVTLGEAIFLPYNTTFAEADSNMWTVVDGNNDGTSWIYSGLLGGFYFDGYEGDAIYYFGSTDKSADEWLVSSPMRFEDGESYELVFDKRISQKGESLNIDIAFGTGDDVAAYETIYSTTIDNFTLEALKLALPCMEGGDYRLGFHIYAEAGGRLMLTNLGVVASTASRVEGIVSSAAGVLEGCTVTSTDGDGQVVAQAVTGSAGGYILPYMEAGIYTLAVSHPNYDTVEQRLDLTESKLATVDFTMSQLAFYSYGGRVTDEKGNGVAGVAVLARNASNEYSATTDSWGSYALDGIVAGDYEIIYFKNSYEEQSLDVEIKSVVEDADVILVRKVLPPSDVVAADGVIEWGEPEEFTELRYDSGEACDATFGYGSGSYYAVVGTVFRQPSVPVSISWFTVNDGYDDHNSVNLFLFAVDEDGNPTNTLLYCADAIANTPGEWVTYHIPEEINCPNGFVAALSDEGGYLTLGADDSSDPDYPFKEKTYISTDDFEKNGFYYLEEVPTIGDDYEYNFMIRAEVKPTGISLDAPKAANAELKTVAAGAGGKFLEKRTVAAVKSEPATAASGTYPAYNIYRLPVSDEDNPEAWTLLNESPVEAFTYTDVEWESLPQGYYKYAVEAVYVDDRISQSSLSEALGKNVVTTLSLSVAAPLSDISVDGAYATLATGDVVIRQDIADGSAIFTGIEKGKYLLTVYAPGCKTYAEELDLSVNDSYAHSVTLEENAVVPFNLNVTVADDASATLSWNMFEIADDFESHTAFTINSPGTVGWSYIDGDGSESGAFVDSETNEYYTFENIFEPMAYIVFNPSLTNPSLGGVPEFEAHSGEQYLVSFVSVEQSDDYLISPELAGTDDFEFSFWANSFTASDIVSVGYSVTGADAADFEWVATDVRLAGGWNHYSYEIPAGARRVVLRTTMCLSALFVDDVAITSRSGASAQSDGIGAHSYTVTLDGKEVATGLDSNSYVFTGLEGGRHTAGVSAVYASGDTEFVTIDFDTASGVQSIDAAPAVRYDASSKTLQVGAGSRVQLYGTSGILYVSADGEQEVDVAGLPAGIYLLRIDNGTSVAVEKIVIK